MKFPNPNKKATAARKFILAYYPNVEDVKIQYYTMDIPLLTVYFNQEDTRIANEDTIFREKIIRDIRNYLGLKGVYTHMFRWEAQKPEFQNPDFYIITSSLNYDPF